MNTIIVNFPIKTFIKLPVVDNSIKTKFSKVWKLFKIKTHSIKTTFKNLITEYLISIEEDVYPISTYSSNEKKNYHYKNFLLQFTLLVIYDSLILEMKLFMLIIKKKRFLMSFIWNHFIVFLIKAESGYADKLLLNPCRINLYSLLKVNKIRYLTSNSFKSFWMSGSVDVNISIAIHELVIKLNILKKLFFFLSRRCCWLRFKTTWDYLSILFIDSSLSIHSF